MSVLKVVQKLAHLDIGNASTQSTAAYEVKTGVYWVCAVGSHAHAHFSGGTSLTSTHDDISIPLESGVLLKIYSPKRCKITAATKGASTVLTVPLGGTPAHAFQVGDYIGLTGSGNANWTNTTTGVWNVQVTAVTNNTITVNLNSSAFADFDTNSPLNCCLVTKYASIGHGNGTLTVTEVQVAGG